MGVSTERMRQRVLATLALTSAVGLSQCTHGASAPTTTPEVVIPPTSAPVTSQSSSMGSGRLPPPSMSATPQPSGSVSQNPPKGGSSGGTAPSPAAPGWMACYPISATGGTCLSSGDPSIGTYAKLPQGFEPGCIVTPPALPSKDLCCYLGIPCSPEPYRLGRPLLVSGAPRRAGLVTRAW